jgi:predicted enzyme related to lactoylglutathione lyase
MSPSHLPELLHPNQTSRRPHAIIGRQDLNKDNDMKRLSVLLTTLSWLVAGVAPADVTLNSIRIAAEDTPALAAFYESAFGMHEINRLDLPAGPEIFLNFGDNMAAASANPGAAIVIMHRDSDDFDDPIAHVIFNVTDIAVTVSALKAAGGTMDREPFAYGDRGLMIAIAVDPVGNLVELIQPASR